MRNIKKAGDILDDFFKSYFDPELAKKIKSTAAIFSAWESIITKAWNEKKSNRNILEAALHSRVKEIEKGVLLIEAEHPGWVQLLQTKKNQLLSTAQQYFPELEIKSISFCLSPEPFSA